MNFIRISSNDDATAYTVGYELLDPSEDPELEAAGFHGKSKFYAVFAPGLVISGYKVSTITQRLPGDADWVGRELRKLTTESDA